MSPRFLLDTDVLSEPVKLRPNRSVLARLERHRSELATASIVVHEILFGIASLPSSRKRSELESYVATTLSPAFPVFVYDRPAAEWHARERARLAGVGQLPPVLDAQIAAIAVTNGLVLVTRNVRDYRRFRELEIEDWFRQQAS